jgi:hypothetical protein
MNLDNLDMDALQRDLEEFAREQAKRGWFRRNWLWFVPTLLIAIVLLGGCVAYWGLFLRVYQLDVYQEAMKHIQADQGMCKTLGEPIGPANWPAPAARVEDSEKDIRWHIQGPKGNAAAHVNAKMMRGKWEIIQLEVDGKRITIGGEGGANDAPVFSTTPAPSTQKPAAATETKAPELNFEIPGSETH